jgi:hypothetical protein
VYLQGDYHLVITAVSSLTALVSLNLNFCNVSDEVLRALSSLTSLSDLNLSFCANVSDEGLRTVSCLTALTTLSFGGSNVSAAAKQALRTAIPNLTIHG